MALVVGYDRDPAGRAALLFAGELAGALGAADLQWTFHQIRGDPAEALLDVAALGHIVSGSVARNVLRHSHRPVVVVPEYGGPT
ncbi:universal stress protein [Mycobacterium kyorinense]|uniref:universal stress protein n=1 Tax=Mycobacterium kyorinense TaxID=487514 RepID=UPI0005EF7B2A|nr:hypothetical protein [Mycobacterium kyorinense]